jgi:hypothetical protein
LVQEGCKANKLQILELLDECNLLENDEYCTETAAEEAVEILNDPEYWAMLEREKARGISSQSENDSSPKRAKDEDNGRN